MMTDSLNANRIDVSASPLGLARIGANIIMGTTARSWNTRMPIVARPWMESLSPLAARALRTMAVLLRDSRKPQNTASCPGTPKRTPTSHANPMTPAT